MEIRGVQDGLSTLLSFSLSEINFQPNNAAERANCTYTCRSMPGNWMWALLYKIHNYIATTILPAS